MSLFTKTSADVVTAIAASEREIELLIADVDPTDDAACEAAAEKRAALERKIQALTMRRDALKRREAEEHRRRLESELAEARRAAERDSLAEHVAWFVEAHREARKRRAQMLTAVQEQAAACARVKALSEQLGVPSYTSPRQLDDYQRSIRLAIGDDIRKRRDEFFDGMEKFFAADPGI